MGRVRLSGSGDACTLLFTCIGAGITSVVSLCVPIMGGLLVPAAVEATTDFLLPLH